MKLRLKTWTCIVLMVLLSTTLVLSPNSSSAAPQRTADRFAAAKPLPASSTATSTVTTKRTSTPAPTSWTASMLIGTDTPHPPFATPLPPTPLPANWQTFYSPTLHIQFRYPADWRTRSGRRVSGADGFAELSLLDLPEASRPILEAKCVLEANSGRPAAYGAGPLISDWDGWDVQRQLSTGRGCLVMPSNEFPPAGAAQAVLFARSPMPQMKDKLVVLRSDWAHFSGILSTLRFPDYVPPPSPTEGADPNDRYNSPACKKARVGQPQTALKTATLVITETALAPSDCDPFLQFDGFQALVRQAKLLAKRPTLSPTKPSLATRAPASFWYKYVKLPTYLLASPTTQLEVFRDRQKVDHLAVPQPSPAGDPVVGFWSWDEHWALEMTSVVVQDGRIVNNDLRYDEVFAWQRVNGQPLFFFRKGSRYGIYQAGREQAPRYDAVIHGQMCCEPAALAMQVTPAWVQFYAHRGNTWYLVQIQIQ